MKLYKYINNWIDIKDYTCCYFVDKIKFKDFDLNNILTDENS